MHAVQKIQKMVRTKKIDEKYASIAVFFLAGNFSFV